MAIQKYLRIFQLAKHFGFRNRHRNCFKLAVVRVQKKLVEEYTNRKLKKREMKQVWITRITAATNEHSMKYPDFRHGLTLSNIFLNRRILSLLANTEPYTFKSLVDHTKYILNYQTPYNKKSELLKLSHVESSQQSYTPVHPSRLGYQKAKIKYAFAPISLSGKIIEKPYIPPDLFHKPAYYHVSDIEKNASLT